MCGMKIVNFAFSIELQALSEWTGMVMIHTSDLSRTRPSELFDEDWQVD
jgi:hypothetical protein